MAELTTLFNQIVDKYSDNKVSLLCTVNSVNSEQGTCSVKPINGEAEIFDVFLQAGRDSSSGVKILPVVNSLVIVNWLDSETAYVALVSEVDKIQISSQNEDLKALLTDLISAIEKLTVPTGAGPSGVPINLAAFTSIKQRLNNLFE